MRRFFARSMAACALVASLVAPTAAADAPPDTINVILPLTGLLVRLPDEGSRVALLSTTDVSGKTGQTELNEIIKEPESAGVALVADEVFGPSDVGVGAQLAKIKAAQPDAIMIRTSGAPLGTALTGARDTGLDSLPIFAASSSMVYTQMLGLQPSCRKPCTSSASASIPTRAQTTRQPAAGISGLYNLNQRNDMHGLGIDDLLIVRWDVQKQTSLPASKFGGDPL
jgi:hypothetical protein